MGELLKTIGDLAMFCDGAILDKQDREKLTELLAKIDAAIEKLEAK